MRTTDRRARKSRIILQRSRFANRGDRAETLRVSAIRLGSSDPRHYPPPEEPTFPLGAPMVIEDVALILGCSPWTVRQKYLPQGLPHLRASAAGKIVFFPRQVHDWILKRQRKEE